MKSFVFVFAVCLFTAMVINADVQTGTVLDSVDFQTIGYTDFKESAQDLFPLLHVLHECDSHNHDDTPDYYMFNTGQNWPCIPCSGMGSISCYGCFGMGGRSSPYGYYTCGICFGTGRAMCGVCKGLGYVYIPDTPPPPPIDGGGGGGGGSSSSRTCNSCNGTGKCTTCRGTGLDSSYRDGYCAICQPAYGSRGTGNCGVCKGAGSIRY